MVVSAGSAPSLTAVFLAASMPLAVLWVLFLADVRLGQPHLFYRYSPLAAERLGRASWAILIGLTGTAALAYALRPLTATIVSRGSRPLSHPGHRSATSRAGGRGTVRPDARRGRSPRIGSAAAVVAGACYAALVAWTYFAPPQYPSQIVFNLESPSHEGAFTAEARRIDDPRQYLRSGFLAGLERTPEEMRGRRVLSNPPLPTIAAWLLQRFMADRPSLTGWVVEQTPGLAEVEDATRRADFASHMVGAMLMTLPWGCSILPAWWLCRRWFSPAGAACIALAIVFNPSTVNFSPGKDPAQMLTVLVLMWGALGAGVAPLERGSPWKAGLTGAAFAASTMLGLIHVWVMAILIGATLWHAAARGGGAVREWSARVALPILVGAALVVAAAQALLGWNLPKTVLAAGLRYGEIQEGIVADPWYLTLVGLPLFLLFVGPMFWILLVAARRGSEDEPARLGVRLLICTLAVMAYTYVFANNNETPRLWMPFIPLLLVGMTLRSGVLRATGGDRSSNDEGGGGVARSGGASLRGSAADDPPVAAPWGLRVCLLVIALQVVVTALHWSMMDVREAEYRMFTTGRMWD
jgi:hypothetical protein